jgi:transposase
MKYKNLKLNMSFVDMIADTIKSDSKIGKYYKINYTNTKHKLENIIEEIIYVLQTGLAWRKIRSPINYNTLYWHHKRFIKYDIYGKIYRRLFRYYGNNNINSLNIQIIDSSFILNKFGKNKIARNKFYRNKNCNKISAITDKNGIPISIIIGKGNIHDLKFFNKHFNDMCIISNRYELNNKYFLADKAYESKKLREVCIKNNYKVLIPKKINSNNDYYFDKIIYKKRIIIENMFAKLKLYRRIMIRYDSNINTYKAFVYLGISNLIYNYLV